MAKAPIMPLFTDALIGDTTHLSAEQFGAYVLILIATWRNNGQALPDDDERMAKICRVSRAKFRQKLRPILSEFFTISESRWRQQRLEIEWERVSTLISKRAANARAIVKQKGSKSTGTHNQKEATLPIQDSESTSSNVESLNAAREGKKNQNMNPEEGRCAPLATCRRPPKSAALKAKIREQLQQKHARFLHFRRRPEELAAYWAAMLDPDPVVAQRAFDETDRRMRCAGWDDMRGWKRAQGIGLDSLDPKRSHGLRG